MAFTFALSLVAAAAQAPCSYDAARLLALPFDKFDQDLDGGWRALEKAGCHDAAAEALRRYRNQHRPLTDDQRGLLLWHEGQVLAFTGDYKRAIPLLLAGVPSGDNGEFTEYALGTVSFMRRDKAGLLFARARLAALPKPPGWTDTVTIMVGGAARSATVPWPPNLNVLDGLIKCFDQPYSKAYFCVPLKLTPTS